MQHEYNHGRLTPPSATPEMTPNMDRLNKGPKACTTCAKAKARCIPRAGTSDVCERCYRLNKQCLSRSPAPPRVRKQPKRSKVAELEKRLNELSSQFDGGQQKKKDDDGSEHDAAPQQAKASVFPISLEHLFLKREHGETDAAEKTDWSPEALRPWESPWPGPSEAGLLMKHYDDQYEALYPFVHIPKDLGPVELRHQRPFLWKAVMMVGCFFDGARQVRLGKELLADIGKAMILDGVKSLDVLQGLQLLIAWFNYALKSTQLTNLLFLARSLCVNLGSKNEGLGLQEDKEKAENFEQLRAYAGTYYLNTLVFTTNKRTDVFMNTAQLESYCRVLETARQYPSDEYLVKLVKIQQLAQTISLTMAFDPGQPAMQLPLTMVVQSFQEQLNSFRSSLPPHLKDDAVLESHISIAEVLLKEISISDQHCNSTIMPLTERLQLLWSCTRSLRAFLTVRYAKSDVEIPRFLCLTASDIAYTFITGTRLLTLRLPGWNLDQIFAELRLGEVIERQIVDLDVTIEKRRSGVLPATGAPMMPLPPGEQAEEDPFTRLMMLLRNVTDLLRMEVQKRMEVKAEGDGKVVDVPMMTDLDEEWWGELMNDTMWDVNGDIMASGML